MSSRQEYHENAYKHYIDRVQDETYALDEFASPLLQNDMGQALETFADTYTEILQDRFQTKNKSRRQCVEELSQLSEAHRINKELRLNSSEDERLSLANYRKDMRSIQMMGRLKDVNKLQRYFDEVKNRTSAYDLESMDFEKDPDCHDMVKMR